MSYQPLVSILMPAYNAEKFISEAIESIIEQDHPNWELLILDDASTDATLSNIRTFEDARIKVFQHEKNFGYLLSCNELFENAKGDFVTFLDADDTCASTRISACVAAFETDSELDFVTTDYIRTDEFGKVISETRTEIYYKRYASDPNYYPTICCATIFLKSELLKKVGAYHPFFQDIGGEDYHWLFRLSRAGKGKHLSELLYSYRQHSGQIHVQNKNPLKYFAADIDQEIRNELILGNDPLLEPEPLRQKWLSRIQSNPSELHFRMASEALNQRKTGVFLSFLIKGLLSFPPKLNSLKHAAYLIYSFFARIA
jgi:glycosyltransferase involved in cell wall biosynthesis